MNSHKERKLDYKACPASIETMAPRIKSFHCMSKSFEQRLSGKKSNQTERSRHSRIPQMVLIELLTQKHARQIKQPSGRVYSSTEPTVVSRSAKKHADWNYYYCRWLSKLSLSKALSSSSRRKLFTSSGHEPVQSNLSQSIPELAHWIRFRFNR
jgi:hypothetical protein